MDLFTAINQRHSYRSAFSEEPVPREHLQQIVQAGIQAPSAKNAQTTDFLIMDDAVLIEQIRGLKPKNQALATAPAIIACIISREPVYVLEHHDFQLEDCAAAVENMLLAITALGYASVWIDGWLRMEERTETIGQWLQLAPEKRLQVLLPVGRPVEHWQQKEKKPFRQRAGFNSWSS